MDEKVRLTWIKREVIDKFVSTDRFEDLAYDAMHSKSNEIYPPYRAGNYCELNCPAAAASLGEHLKSGQIDPAYCNPMVEGGSGYGFDVSKNSLSKQYSWKEAGAAIAKQLKVHGEFVVVEATRSEKQMKDNGLSENRYFTVVNVKGKLFTIDAFGGIVNDNLKDYIDNTITATSYWLVKGELKVKVVLSK